MAAQPTRKRRELPPVEQPPRTIVRGGQRIDVSHLTGDDLFEAITTDEEQWDYQRLAAETGRSVVRLRKWVSNAYKSHASGEAEDDKTFIVPEDRIGGSPWWYAGKSRAVLIQIGVMDRDGRAKPYRPTGRKAGAKDLVKRRRWSKAPLRDTAAQMYREYLELTQRKDEPLTDRQARAELCKRHSLTRTQLARRITTGREQVDTARPAEISNEELAARLEALLDVQYRAGVNGRTADSRARERLAEETGLSRRQIAARVTLAVRAAADSTEGDG